MSSDPKAVIRPAMAALFVVVMVSTAVVPVVGAVPAAPPDSTSAAEGDAGASAVGGNAAVDSSAVVVGSTAAEDSSTAARDSSTAGVVVPDERGGHVVMPVFEVRASILRPQPQADAEELRTAAIEARDATSVADLAPLVPDSRASMNSRGETVLMVRGAPERQIVIQQDGIPLTLPWDERADLSLLPVQAIGTVRVTRGAGSVLTGPNAVAGFVDLRTRERSSAGYDADLLLSMGEVDHYRAAGLVDWAGESWQGLAAISHDQLDGFLVPQDDSAPFNQDPTRRTRTNSDTRRTSALLKGVRHWSNGSRLALSLQGYDAQRGVPPEDYLADARFWRYPEIQRGLAGLELQLRPDEGRRWRMDLNLSYDGFHQEIRKFDDASYQTPELTPGVSYETDDDRTGYGRVQLSRILGKHDTLALALSSRYTHHNESLELDGPEQSYSEWLSGAALEWEKRHKGSWGLRLGAGVDWATTPLTGDKPARDGQSAPSWSARGTKEFADRGELYLQLARRSRFPSLRELYSGALGRFVPNFDLKPEDQTSVEIGGGVHGRRWSLGASAFGYLTEDGIVKKSLPSHQFQRVNEEEIRVLGLELRGTWRPRPGLRIEGHHSFLHARARQDGAFDARVEDRPDFLSWLDVSQQWRWGGSVGVEMVATGARYSQDLTAGGLVKLPSQIQWNLRAAWKLVVPSSWFTSSEIFVRVDNVLDTTLLYQAGLPQPGRQLRVGLDTRLGN